MAEVLKGFTEVQRGSKQRRRLIMSTEAREKRGKSHFGLTMPGPIAVFDMDRGLEGVVDKFADEKVIRVVDYRGLPSMKQEHWEARWEKFKQDYEVALNAPASLVRSVLVDTGTELWEYARLALLGRLTNVLPHHYVQVNQEFRRVIDAAFDHDKNLLLTHKLKKEYKTTGGDDKGHWTGKYERAGFSEIEYLAQVVLRHGRRSGDDGGEFFTEVVECRQNPALQGEEFEGELSTFPFVASQVLPSTEMEDWM